MSSKYSFSQSSIYIPWVIRIFLHGGVVIEFLPLPSWLLPSARFIRLQYPWNNSNWFSNSFTPSGPFLSASAQHSSHNCFEEYLAQTDPTFWGLLKLLFIIDWLKRSFRCPPLSSFHLSLTLDVISFSIFLSLVSEIWILVLLRIDSFTWDWQIEFIG